MVGQVVIDRARGDGSRGREGECRECVRVVKSGDLGDHAADADARQVRRPVVKRASQGRRIGGEIAQRVLGGLGIDGARFTGVAQVVPHHVTPAAGAQILGDDPVAARTAAAHKWDRTPGTEPAVQMDNQLGMVFAKLDCSPRWRERLPELAIPALVVHGRRDPFFPVGNGEALAREIPGARLLVLGNASTAIPPAAANNVATAMLAL